MKRMISEDEDSFGPLQQSMLTFTAWGICIQSVQPVQPTARGSITFQHSICIRTPTSSSISFRYSIIDTSGKDVCVWQEADKGLIQKASLRNKRNVPAEKIHAAKKRRCSTTARNGKGRGHSVQRFDLELASPTNDNWSIKAFHSHSRVV